ncbi:hypothetical protein GCM10011391_13980 [Pullulanibacillus camelliae]|uniref:Uncharacterized protein n=1 Tax=Pullulanibacillus camelliae TaxID=1707096 RepID=A0A8J2YCC2_9BACL|nr:hypothetical protein [Pullulanibacillus camelliae]GGE36384.1 hypothetical protein GCM10011391_13980 [Pullulanibacillus camelliae]
MKKPNRKTYGHIEAELPFDTALNPASTFINLPPISEDQDIKSITNEVTPDEESLT